MSPMVKTIKLSAEVGFLAGSDVPTNSGADVSGRDPSVDDPMAKGGGLFDIDFFEGASYNDF